MGITKMVSELKTPLLLEIQTEHFVEVVSLLTCHGYSVKARPDNPSRHVVVDDLPDLERDGAA
jgi:hypothetical protein